MKIDGVDYGYHYPLGVLRRFEKRTKLNVFALGNIEKLSSEAAGYLVYYGVKAWADREGEPFNYTYEELLDKVSLVDVQEAIVELFGEQEDGEKKS